MEKCLKALESSLSVSGVWLNWQHLQPDIFQVTFKNVQLSHDSSPKIQGAIDSIALNFIQPQSINFLLHKDANIWIVNDWPQLLQQGMVGPFKITSNSFVINRNLQILRQIIEAKLINTTYGFGPETKKFYEVSYRIVFWAGDFGVAVGASDLDITTPRGPIKLEEIPMMYQRWWAYFRRYWQLKGTAAELPLDEVCEATARLGHR